MQTPSDTLTGFFVISCLLGLSPGPDNLFVLTQAALRGSKAGLAVTAGLCTGLLGHTAAVVLGLATLLASSPAAFTLLRLCGATYLLWLAWQAFRPVTGTGTGTTDPVDAPLLTGWQLYRRGILMNISNPKVSLFFLAFLPQFVTPDGSPVPAQLMLLGGIFIAATLLVFGTIALLAGQVGELLTRSISVRRILQRTTGAVFVALAFKLLLGDRR